MLYKERAAELFADDGWADLIDELRQSGGVISSTQRRMKHHNGRDVIVRLGA